MRYRNVILIVLLIPIYAAIILYFFKFVTKFKFNDFMSTLEYKLYENKIKPNETNADEIITEFSKVFFDYSGNNWFSILILKLGALIILILTAIELLLLVIIQLKRTCCGCCKETFSFIFTIHSLFDMLIYFVFSFDPVEINLEEDQIYSFDEEFNKEIKNNLDFMKKRRIYLIVCSSVAILGVIAQLVIVILNMRQDCCYKNKNNDIPEIVVYTAENTNQANNVNSNNETDKRAI